MILNIQGFLYGVVLLIACTSFQIEQPSIDTAAMGLGLGIALGVSNILLSMIPRTPTPLRQMLQRDYIATSLITVIAGILISPVLGVPLYKASELNLVIYCFAFAIPAGIKMFFPILG